MDDENVSPSPPATELSKATRSMKSDSIPLQSLVSRPTRDVAKSRFGFLVPAGVTEPSAASEPAAASPSLPATSPSACSSSSRSICVLGVESRLSKAPAAQQTIGKARSLAPSGKITINTRRRAATNRVLAALPKSRRPSSGLPAPRVSAGHLARSSGVADGEEAETSKAAPAGRTATSQTEAEVIAQNIFGELEPELDQLARGKLRLGARLDYKDKVNKRDDCIRKLRQGLAALLDGKQIFVQQCAEMEKGFKQELGEAKQAADTVDTLDKQIRSLAHNAERTKQELRDVQAQKDEATNISDDLSKQANLLERTISDLRVELKQTTSALELLREHSDGISLERQGLADRLTRLTEEGDAASTCAAAELANMTSKLNNCQQEVEVVRLEKASIVKELAELRGEMRERQGRREAEDGERIRLATENSKLREDVKGLMVELAHRAEDVGRAQVELAALAKELSHTQDCRKDGEVAQLKAEKEAGDLRAKVEYLQEKVEDKNDELTSALRSFADMQRITTDREQELRRYARDLDQRAMQAESRVKEVEHEVQQSITKTALHAAEMKQLKETLDFARQQAKETAEADKAARDSLQELIATVKLETELRTRAEQKEQDERAERIAANAQLLAMQQAHAAALEQQKEQSLQSARDSDDKLKSADAEQDRLHKELRGSEELRMTLESEFRTLKRALEDAESRTEQLVELGKLSGEAEVLRHRLREGEKDKHALQKRHEQIVMNLERSILDGENKRRIMHNQIQELRGNVRVYARVRPFLPADEVAEGTEPSLEVDSHGEGLRICKRDAAQKILEKHSFVFDRCFAPSVGQEGVFAEVSELVQSACDGYNVCLFSYGQTASGKTHTMSGISNGPMRGIIPRSMEQVGRYKRILEAQGWEYHMHVTFIEIYSEQIRDLLRGLSTGASENLQSSCDDHAAGTSHEIKRDPKTGEISVTNITKVDVDPADPEAIGRIIEIAARCRSVGATDMNAHSSRSHSIFTLHLRANNHEQRSGLVGKLNLCDLAGSERLSRSNSTGERLKEAQAINKSLSALTDVFVAIANKQQHIPFRNSKLTFLLSPSLSGDGKTLMMVNLSPTDSSYFESLCTLRFAQSVNNCELGQARKHISQTTGIERASTATAPTASSVSKEGRRR